MNDNQPLPFDQRLKRARYRAEHRGTKEADLVVGGFFARHHPDWDEAALAWFEALLQEQDVDILAWAFGTAQPPGRYQGRLMENLKKLDYVDVLK
ncbi:FAD assembly factor SdhE [Sandarakinorhabdus rubra]|uniref:FAD assembly factor SdhE n=1 Tax=Sandarakinorhabdus rubra TaxID=2672568 RepID=UPI0013DBD153|nr:succinate dehydrogenase assembly factor 2 [Sandarakinorhabdus rubra]